MQAKIEDYYRRKLDPGPSSSTGSIQPHDDKKHYSTKSLLEEVCEELDSIDIIIDKTKNTVVECIKKPADKPLNGNNNSSCSPKSYRKEVCYKSTDDEHPVASTSKITHFDNELVEKIPCAENTPVENAEHVVIHAAPISGKNLIIESSHLSNSVDCPESFVNDKNTDEVNTGSNCIDVNTAGFYTLANTVSNNSDNSVFTVIESADVFQNIILPQGINVEVIAEDSTDAIEEMSSLLESSSQSNNDVSSEKEKLPKNIVTKRVYRTAESKNIRNTKARRITAKMKAEWAAQIKNNGHLVCPMPGCHQTYVSVANFQTHYKYCTGKKNLQHCPYCDSIIFSSQEAVLHHMTVEHPEKVEEYKEKYPCREPETSEENNKSYDSRPFVNRIYRKYSRWKSFKNRSKLMPNELIICNKKISHNHKLKSNEQSMSKNYNEFAKCVRFNDIVSKINAVSGSDGPQMELSTLKSPSKLTKKILSPAPILKQTGNSSIDDESLPIGEGIDEEGEYIDCPDFALSDAGLPIPLERIGTKARFVLKTAGYERFIEHLKLTRDWASERKTYSRSRPSDGSSSIFEEDGSMMAEDVDDSFVLHSSNNPISVSVFESEIDSNKLLVSLMLRAKSSMKNSTKNTPAEAHMTPRRRQVPSISVDEELKEINSLFEIDDKEIHRRIKTEKEGHRDGKIITNHFPATVTTEDQTSVPKQNKFLKKQRTTCYDNASNLSDTGTVVQQKEYTTYGSRYVQKDSSFDGRRSTNVNEECQNLVVDFETVRQFCTSTPAKNEADVKSKKAKSKFQKKDGIKHPESTKKVPKMPEVPVDVPFNLDMPEVPVDVPFNLDISVTKGDFKLRTVLFHTIKKKMKAGIIPSSFFLPGASCDLNVLQYELDVVTNEFEYINAVSTCESVVDALVSKIDLEASATNGDDMIQPNQNSATLTSVDENYFISNDTIQRARMFMDDQQCSMDFKCYCSSEFVFHVDKKKKRGRRPKILLDLIDVYGSWCEKKVPVEKPFIIVNKVPETVLDPKSSDTKKDNSVIETSNTTKSRRGRPPKRKHDECSPKEKLADDHEKDGVQSEQPSKKRKTEIVVDEQPVLKEDDKHLLENIPDSVDKGNTLQDEVDCIERTVQEFLSTAAKNTESQDAVTPVRKSLRVRKRKLDADEVPVVEPKKPFIVTSDNAPAVKPKKPTPDNVPVVKAKKPTATPDNIPAVKLKTSIATPDNVPSVKSKKFIGTPDNVSAMKAKTPTATPDNVPAVKPNNPIAIADNSPVVKPKTQVTTSDNEVNSVKKKRGRPPKKRTDDHPPEAVKTSEKRQMEATKIENVDSKDSPESLTIADESQASSGRKCSRKGRPRKCVRYEVLNSGIDVEDRDTVDGTDQIEMKKARLKQKNSSPDVKSSVQEKAVSKEVSREASEDDSKMVAESVKTEATEELSTEQPQMESESQDDVCEDEEVIEQAKDVKDSDEDYVPSAEEGDDVPSALDNNTTASKSKSYKIFKTRAGAKKHKIWNVRPRFGAPYSTEKISSIVEAKRKALEKHYELLLKNFPDQFRAPILSKQRVASKEKIAQWVKSLESTGRIVCDREGCGKVLKSKNAIMYHYEKACLKLSKYVCKICNKTVINCQSMYTHLMKKHPGKKTKPDSLVPSKYNVKMRSVRAKQGSNKSSPATKAVPLEYKYENLLPDMKPAESMWQISDSLLDSCALNSPLNIRVCDINISDKSKEIWTSLSCFKSYPESVNSSRTTFYTGGEITCSAFCPVPSNKIPKQKEFKQYVIVATKTAEKKSLLQLWEFAELTNKTIGAAPSVKIAFFDDCERVRQMVWCPSGTWESPDVACSEEKILPRLGVVAITSGAYVKLFSVPHPDGLSRSSPVSSCPLFNALPVTLLKSPSNDTNVVCLTLTWQKSDNCKLIAAGYDNGFIHIWNVVDVSRWLIHSEGIFPIQTIRAHTAAVSAVEFSPLSGFRYIASCGCDKYMKLWDIYEPSCPVQSTRKGNIKHAVWPTIWSGLFVSWNNNYVAKPVIGYQDFTHKRKYQNIARFIENHKGQILCISPQLNMIAIGDSSGTVTITDLIKINADSMKAFSLMPLGVYKTELESLEQTQTSNNQDSSKDTATEEATATENIKVEELKSDKNSNVQGIVFKKFVVSGNTMKEEDEEIFGVSNPGSISSMCWNPNDGLCHWLFTTHQSGLGRLICTARSKKMT